MLVSQVPWESLRFCQSPWTTHFENCDPKTPRDKWKLWNTQQSLCWCPLLCLAGLRCAVTHESVSTTGQTEMPFLPCLPWNTGSHRNTARSSSPPVGFAFPSSTILQRIVFFSLKVGMGDSFTPKPPTPKLFLNIIYIKCRLSSPNCSSGYNFKGVLSWLTFSE